MPREIRRPHLTVDESTASALELVGAAAVNRLTVFEVDRLQGEVARQNPSRVVLGETLAAIAQRWATLAAAHPGLEDHARRAYLEAPVGTEDFHRVFIGEFPGLPHRALTRSDEDLIYGAFHCLTDYAATLGTLAMLEPQAA